MRELRAERKGMVDMQGSTTYTEEARSAAREGMQTLSNAEDDPTESPPSSGNAPGGSPVPAVIYVLQEWR